jgi:ATP-dependent Clp protease adapter protein ClpS
MLQDSKHEPLSDESMITKLVNAFLDQSIVDDANEVIVDIHPAGHGVVYFRKEAGLEEAMVIPRNLVDYAVENLKNRAKEAGAPFFKQKYKEKEYTFKFEPYPATEGKGLILFR